MANDPAFLFYPSDFLTGTFAMSNEQVGAYIRLLCLQHQQGHMRPKTCGFVLGSMSVSDQQEVLAKFETDGEGNLYNQRLAEEIDKRRKYVGSCKKNGALGGRPKNPRDNPPATHRETQTKASRVENENDNNTGLPKEDTQDTRLRENSKRELFDEFWEAYPKKKSKGDAEKAWKSLNPGKELVAIMLEKLAQATTCREWTKDGGQYIPYPATWLRAKGWEDVLPDAMREEDPHAAGARTTRAGPGAGGAGTVSPYGSDIRV